MKGMKVLLRVNRGCRAHQLFLKGSRKKLRGSDDIGSRAAGGEWIGTLDVAMKHDLHVATSIERSTITA